MAPLRLVSLLALSLVLMAPAATAASGQGDLRATALTLSPDGVLASPGLDVAARGETPTLTLDATDVHVQRIGRTEVRQGDPGSAGSISYQLNEIDERASYAGARLSLVPATGDSIVALRSLGPATATAGSATVRGVGAALLAEVGVAADACLEGDELYCMDAFGVYEIAAPATVVDLSGELTLLLYGPALRVIDADGGETVFASGPVDGQGAGTASQTEDAWVVVRAKSAVGGLQATGASLYATAPTLRASEVVLRDADGAVRVGALDYRASGEDVTAIGDITLTPGPVAPAEALDARDATVYAPAFSTRMSGEVRSIDLDARVAFLDTPLERAGAAALVAGIAAFLVYGWQHLSFAAAALYTRLKKPEILANDVRSHIFDIIKQNPGISAREVHRRSEQSWGTVVYHLRQLERHHIVVSRALGRTRNYYENHGKYRGMEIQLACLQSDRARVLARAIATQPGITQEVLATVSGLPQPTTSYYVRKLKMAGLVEEQRDGRYVKYVPHADLPRFIEMSESEPTVGASAASGVQA